MSAETYRFVIKNLPRHRCSWLHIRQLGFCVDERAYKKKKLKALNLKFKADKTGFD
jgi:hypothetical protein